MSSSPGRLKSFGRPAQRFGIELRPGAVHEARAANGLTLAQVAGAELTRAAIHRIEKGQSRPSIRTLTLIAERTGKPLSFFLADIESQPPAPELGLERLSALGSFDAVLSHGTRLLAEGTLAGHELALVHYWIGEAHVRLMQPEAALEHLEAAVLSLEENGDPWMAAHALHMKSSALYLMDDPESKFVAEAALSRCRELKPPAPMLEARVLNHLAAIAVNREEWQQAIRLYDRAVATAGPLRNLRQLSLMYEGLGMAYHHLGRVQQASGYFNKALGLYTLQSDMSSMARAETNLSLLLMEEGNLASAEDHLEQSLRFCEEEGVDRRNRTYAMVGLAKLRLRQGRVDEADQLATATIELGIERGESLSLATALQVRGQLLSRDDRGAEGAAAYQQAVDIYGSLNLLNRLRACRIEYAEALEAQGRSGEAANQWKQAALIGYDSSRAPAEGLIALA